MGGDGDGGGGGGGVGGGGVGASAPPTGGWLHQGARCVRHAVKLCCQRAQNYRREQQRWERIKQIETFKRSQCRWELKIRRKKLFENKDA